VRSQAQQRSGKKGWSGSDGWKRDGGGVGDGKFFLFLFLFLFLLFSEMVLWALLSGLGGADGGTRCSEGVSASKEAVRCSIVCACSGVEAEVDDDDEDDEDEDDDEDDVSGRLRLVELDLDELAGRTPPCTAVF
jgi:hypothetical protein